MEVVWTDLAFLDRLYEKVSLERSSGHAEEEVYGGSAAKCLAIKMGRNINSFGVVHTMNVDKA